jgi:hypothetical protein
MGGCEASARPEHNSPVPFFPEEYMVKLIVARWRLSPFDFFDSCIEKGAIFSFRLQQKYILPLNNNYLVLCLLPKK